MSGPALFFVFADQSSPENITEKSVFSRLARNLIGTDTYQR
jgi:hypothetical protein